MNISGIIRVYEKDPIRAIERAQFVADAATHLLDKTASAIEPLKSITIAVWNDRRFVTELGEDCAASTVILSELQSSIGKDSRIKIMPIVNGDIFCEALNQPLHAQENDGQTHSLIISPEVVHKTFSLPIYEETVRAMYDGAYVSGPTIFGDLDKEKLLIPDHGIYHSPHTLDESVLHGRIANTFALWDIHKLRSVGGFPKISRKRAPEEERAFVEHDGKRYELSGVEEIIAIMHLIKRYGRGIVPIITSWERSNDDFYKVLSLQQKEQHEKKLLTKFIRQTLMAEFGWNEIQQYIDQGILPNDLYLQNIINGDIDPVALLYSGVKEVRILPLIESHKEIIKEVDVVRRISLPRCR